MPRTSKVDLKTATVKAKPVAKVQAPRTAAKKAIVEPKKAEVTSLSVGVYGMDGKAAGRVSLPSEIFGAKVNPVLMSQAVRVYLANQRVGTASTKTRSEVRGTTKKIYRQKGTGRARHGAKKAPIFVGGGISLGPKPRDFSLDMPKKMRQKALFSALTSKLQENMLKVVDMSTATGKTKQIASALKALGAENTLLVVDSESKMAQRAAKNIKNTKVIAAQNLNTYEVLNSKTMLLTRGSIETVKKTFLKV